HGRTWRQIWRSLWPWAVLAVACAAVARLAPPAPHIATEVALWQRPLIAVDALAFYMGKLAWPASLAVDYGRRPAVVIRSHIYYLTWLAPAAVAALLWAFRRRAQVLVAASLVFLAGVAPVLGLVRFDSQDYSTVADHYLYLPM